MKSSPHQLLQRHGLTILIGALVVGSLGVIGYETQWGTNLRPLSASAVGQVAKSGDTSLLPAFGLPTMDSGFRQTLDRPLFLPTRRPVPVVIGATAPSMKKGQFRLAGTVVNQILPYAFLVEISTGKGMRVAKGADVLSTGITLLSVDGTRVVLKQGDETEELTLRTASSPAAAPGPLGVVQPGTAQPPPPSGVVVSGVPGPPAVFPASQGVATVTSIPGGLGATAPLPGSSALPGFVQSSPGPVPNAAPTIPAENAARNPRRRSPNVPQQ